MKPLLIGESNPYGGNPEHALFPWPEGCSGWRLCHRVLDLDPVYYLEAFDRANLIVGDTWSIPAARTAAAALTHDRRILLGAKVAAAHGKPFAPFASAAGEGWRGFIWPHPSGRNARLWTIEAMRTARQQLALLRDPAEIRNALIVTRPCGCAPGGDCIHSARVQ